MFYRLPSKASRIRGRRERDRPDVSLPHSSPYGDASLGPREKDEDPGWRDHLPRSLNPHRGATTRSRTIENDPSPRGRACVQG
jgi:hypothetical protein